MKIILYHGSTVSIEHPLAKAGRTDLDFGKGFYLTSLRSSNMLTQSTTYRYISTLS